MLSGCWDECFVSTIWDAWLVAWIAHFQKLMISFRNQQKYRSLAMIWKIGQPEICNGDHTYNQPLDMRIIP